MRQKWLFFYGILVYPIGYNSLDKIKTYDIFMGVEGDESMPLLSLSCYTGALIDAANNYKGAVLWLIKSKT